MPDISPWTPRVLTNFEWGQCIASIEAVQRLDKPIAEVSAVKAFLPDLEADLEGCLGFFRGTSDVKFWTREADPGRYRYGFYKAPWTLQALDFLDRMDLSRIDRAWISGLLFGYRPGAIQEFIEARQGQRVTAPEYSRGHRTLAG